MTKRQGQCPDKQKHMLNTTDNTSCNGHNSFWDSADSRGEVGTQATHTHTHTHTQGAHTHECVIHKFPISEGTTRRWREHAPPWFGFLGCKTCPNRDVSARCQQTLLNLRVCLLAVRTCRASDTVGSDPPSQIVDETSRGVHLFIVIKNLILIYPHLTALKTLSLFTLMTDRHPYL